MTLNDLKGGSATATIYFDDGTGYKKASEHFGFRMYEYDDGEGNLVKFDFSTCEYDPATDTGDEWAPGRLYCPIGKLEYEDGPFIEGHTDVLGVSGKIKAVFDITYPDGETETLETASRNAYFGVFYDLNREYGDNGFMLEQTPGTDETVLYTISFDVIVNTDLLNPEDSAALVMDTGSGDSTENAAKILDPRNNAFWSKFYDPVSIHLHDAEVEQKTIDGVYHIYFKYTYDSPFPAGNYAFYPYISYTYRYKGDTGEMQDFWYPESGYEITIP